MSPSTPCQFCKDRYIGCHSECTKYKSFREELDKEKEEAEKKKSFESEIWGYVHDRQATYRFRKNLKDRK